MAVGEPPVGYTVIDFRRPRSGERYIYANEKRARVLIARGDHDADDAVPRLIVQKRPEPKLLPPLKRPSVVTVEVEIDTAPALAKINRIKEALES